MKKERGASPLRHLAFYENILRRSAHLRSSTWPRSSHQRTQILIGEIPSSTATQLQHSGPSQVQESTLRFDRQAAASPFLILVPPNAVGAQPSNERRFGEQKNAKDFGCDSIDVETTRHG